MYEIAKIKHLTVLLGVCLALYAGAVLARGNSNLNLPFERIIGPDEALVFCVQVQGASVYDNRWILVSKKSTLDLAPELYSYVIYLIGAESWGSRQYKRYIRRQLEGNGEVRIVFGNLIGEGERDIFLTIEEQRTTTYVFHIEGETMRVAYQCEQGRARTECEDMDGDGLFELIVYNSYLHNFVPEKEIDKWCKQIAGHPFLIFIYKIKGGRYVLAEIMPDMDREAREGKAWLAPSCN